MNDKSKRKEKSRTIIDMDMIVFVSFVTLVGSGCLLFAGLVFLLVATSEVEGERAIARIENILNIEMPVSSEDVYFADEFWGDRLYPELIFRFTASADEIEAWLQNETFCFEHPLSVTDDTMIRRDINPDWWLPHLAENPAIDSCYHMTSPNGTWVIQIDQSNADTWIVYFEMWHY